MKIMNACARQHFAEKYILSKPASMLCFLLIIRTSSGYLLSSSFAIPHKVMCDKRSSSLNSFYAHNIRKTADSTWQYWLLTICCGLFWRFSCSSASPPLILKSPWGVLHSALTSSHPPPLSPFDLKLSPAIQIYSFPAHSRATLALEFCKKRFVRLIKRPEIFKTKRSLIFMQFLR